MSTGGSGLTVTARTSAAIAGKTQGKAILRLRGSITDAQKQRLTHLRPHGRAIIRALFRVNHSRGGKSKARMKSKRWCYYWTALGQDWQRSLPVETLKTIIEQCAGNNCGSGKLRIDIFVLVLQVWRLLCLRRGQCLTACARKSRHSEEQDSKVSARL